MPHFKPPPGLFPIRILQEFAWDNSLAYPGNTAYCIPTAKKYLCALLNSRLTEYIYARLSPQIRGGFYRFIAQYMEQLPVIEPSLEDQARLSALVDDAQYRRRKTLILRHGKPSAAIRA